MSHHLHDLLEDPLLTVTVDGRRQAASLPRAMAILSTESTVSFGCLQAHQRQPWHAFLVQLAAVALERAGHAEFPTPRTSGPGGVDTWRELLLRLTGNSHAPWCLVVDSLAKAAFLQPPVPEDTLAALKKTAATPDELDILMTARSFDVKRHRVAHARPEHWLFALVSKQTFEGYSGSRNYGIVRMNGGLASRPCVAAMPDLGWSARFRRDTSLWLQRSHALVDEYGYDIDGSSLLWLDPWDGSTSLPRTQLHPCFIEVCRRIRLRSRGEGLVGHVGSSAKPRVDATGSTGDTGDIWTPLRATRKKGQTGKTSLTVTTSGFTYRRLHDVLFGDWERPPALVFQPGDSYILAVALARGQGITEGFHERVLEVPPEARPLLASGDTFLRARSFEQLERVDQATRSILKPAISALFQGLVEKLDFQDQRGEPWLTRFDSRVDERFFPHLFSTSSLHSTEAMKAWDAIVVGLLEVTFEEALREVPVASTQQYRIRAVADILFQRALRKAFPPTETEPKTEQSMPNPDTTPAPLWTVIGTFARRLGHESGARQRAELRRLDYRNPTGASFWSFSAALEASAPRREAQRVDYFRRWAAILSGLAEIAGGGLHKPFRHLGVALAEASLPEAQVERLVRARGDTLLALVRGLAVQLASSGTRVDWTDVALLVLSNGRADQDKVRRRVSRQYYATLLKTHPEA